MAGRVQQLDVLRGVAVLLVLVHHSPGGEGALLKAGWTGVDLFFILSGFLVSGLLFKEHLRSGRIRPGRFYLRRGLKIYPNFYTMLAVTSAALAWAHVPVEPRNVPHEVVFVQNYLPAAWWGREHAWSLAIEEHFYFLLPPVLILLLWWGPFRRAPVLTLPRLLPKPLGPALAYVGFYSYSIYLWHLPLLAVVRNAFGDRAPAVALFYAGSIVLGVLMAKLVELPALRLRERWFPGQPAR